MKRILIVEDEVALLESLVVLFEMHDFSVASATNGGDAIKKLSSGYAPDVIVCDINLPGISGYDVLKYVREHEDNYRVPLIFLSAYADKQDIRAGMDMGADDYITKPFSVADLVNAVKAKLEKHARADKLHKNEIAKQWIKLFDHNFRQEFYEPLNVAINTSRMCMDRAGDCYDEIKEPMSLMLQSCFRMFRNSRNLVLKSSLQAGELAGALNTRSQVHIYSILNDCLSHYDPQLKYEADCALPVNDATCKSDSEMLGVIFTELIDNGVKFAVDKPPVIRLSAHENGHFTFSVSNATNMPAIFTVDQVHAFTKFHNDTAHNGFGLGLHIVKEICAILGYQLSVSFSGKYCTVMVTSQPAADG